MRESIMKDKSKAFALRIINLYKYLTSQKNEFVMSKQLLRCGTSVGANIHEAYFAQSKADFLSKLGIALKENGESEYWIELLRDSNYLSQEEAASILLDCTEMGKILTSSIKTTKANL